MSPDAAAIDMLRRPCWFASLPPAPQARIAQLALPRRFGTGQTLLRG